MHRFNVDHTAKASDNLVNNLNVNSIHKIHDFSENYTCLLPEEIRLLRCVQETVRLYPILPFERLVMRFEKIIKCLSLMMKNTMCSLLRNVMKSCTIIMWKKACKSIVILSIMMTVHSSLNVYLPSAAWQGDQLRQRTSSERQAMENQIQMALVVWSRLLHHVLYVVRDASLEMQSSWQISLTKP